MPRWRVSGLIVAERLPQQPIEFLGCGIAPIAGGPVSTPDFHMPFGIVPAPGFQGAIVWTYRAHIKFEARHRIETMVTADFQDEALEIARRRFGRCLSAFAFAGNPLAPGMVEATEWWRLLDSDESVVMDSGGVGTSAAMMPALIAPIDAATARNLQAIADLDERDPAVRELLGLWHDAEMVHLLAFENRDRQEEVLRYAHVLEKIGQAMAPGLKTETPAAIKRVVDRLRTRLGAETTDSDISAHAAAVDEARREIQTLRLETIGQQIRAAGVALTLTKEATDAAIETWSARNRLVGHPSEVLVEARDGNNAHLAAASFLQGYLVWRSHRT